MVLGHFDLKFGFLAKNDVGNSAPDLKRRLGGEMHLFFFHLPYFIISIEARGGEAVGGVTFSRRKLLNIFEKKQWNSEKQQNS